MNRKFAIVYLALLLVLSITALLARRAKQRSNELLASINASQATLMHELERSRQKIQATAGTGAEVPEAASTSETASRERLNKPIVHRTRPPSTSQLMREYPDLFELYLDTRQTQIAQDFGPFFQAANVSPEKIETFARRRAERHAKVDWKPGRTTLRRGLLKSPRCCEKLINECGTKTWRCLAKSAAGRSSSTSGRFMCVESCMTSPRWSHSPIR